MAPRWGGLRLEPYKSEPIDADMDKIVQEGTAWERPGGTRMLDRFGKEILTGLTATTRPRDIRIVDKKDNAVAYTPTYGDQGFEEAPSVVTDVGPAPQDRSGLRTIQTTTVSQQEELRKAREAREAQREREEAAGLPPVPEMPPDDPDAWGSQAALRAEFRRTGRLDAPLTPESEPVAEIDLEGTEWPEDEEERADAAVEAVAAIARKLIEPADEAGDYTTVNVLEPQEGESALIKAAKEIIESPRVVALKKKLQRLTKFKTPVAGYENSGTHGEVADYRREVGKATVFFRDVHAMLQNMGVTSIEDAAEIIRDGFEVDGRLVVFVGKPLVAPSDTSSLSLTSTKDSLRKGFYVLDENGAPLVPVDVDEIPEEMMQALVDRPDADIPLELLVEAVREATRGEGAEASEAAAELEQAVSRVGKLLGEEVRTRRAKDVRESSRPKDFLSELLGRTDEELASNSSNDAAAYISHAAGIGLNLDALEEAHITDPVGTARINEVGAAVAERVLGYIPEWAQADRPDKPHDPGVGYADEAEGGAWDVEGEEGGWPVHQAMWNGDPLVLMDGLVESLVTDFVERRITEEELLDTLQNLPTLVAEALRDEIETQGEGMIPSDSVTELIDRLGRGFAEFVDDPLFREFVEMAEKVRLAEKDPRVEPLSDEVLAFLGSTDDETAGWEHFSRLRGYTEEEIADFRRYLEVMEKLRTKYPQRPQPERALGPDNPDLVLDVVNGLRHPTAKRRGVKVRKQGSPGTPAPGDILHPHYFRHADTRELARAQEGITADMANGVNGQTLIQNMLRIMGAPEEAGRNINLDEAMQVIRNFTAEFKLRLIYGSFPANEETVAKYPEDSGIQVGDLAPSKISTPQLSHARGESLLENAWQLAVKDALRQKQLGDLKRAGRLPSVGEVRDEGLHIRDVLREIREFARGSDVIRGLLRGPGRSRSTSDVLNDDEVTPGELVGEFDHHLTGTIATFHGKEARMGELLQPVIDLMKRKLDPGTSLKEKKKINQEIENYLAFLELAEESVVAALESYPIDWVRRLGLAGVMALATHKEVGPDGPKPEGLVPFVPVKRSSFSGWTQRTFMWQPWSNGGVSLSPEGGDATALHEITHRMDQIHPMFRPLIWAHILRRYGLPPDSTSMSLREKVTRINSMPARQRGGVVGYDDSEIALDLFPAGYMGRVYLDTSDHRFIDNPSWSYGLDIPLAGGTPMYPMEFLTVAMEALSLPAEQRPFFLYEEGVDSETANFILGLLAMV